MSRRPMSPEEVLGVLEATPQRLDEITRGLTPEQHHATPAAGEWSLIEGLAHLRSCAEVWGDAIEVILGAEHPTIRAVNPTTWIERTDYRQVGWPPSLQAFSAQRGQLLARLRTLPEVGWSRAATVVGAGRPLERTVRTYATWLAGHERTHWRQLAETASAARTTVSP